MGKLTRQEFEEYIKEQNQTAIEEERGKICPVMTKDLGYPIYCQHEDCQLWVGLGHQATGHCGLRRL